MVAEPQSDDLDALGDILAEWLDLVHGGKTPNRQEFLARFPAHAKALLPFLDDWQEFRVETEKLQDVFTLHDPSRTLATPAALATDKRPTIFGEFEVLGVLGQGGMGVVYRARQLPLNRLVALKLLKHENASPEQIRRLQNEAKLAAGLEHPNIVPVFQVGETGGQPYFAMKLIEGLGLEKRLDEFRQQPRESAKLMATVARAIHHAHQRGVLHRDIKPSNILVDAQGVPHVSDFGLAKQVEGDSSLTQSGALVGTPSFMAPEQTLANNQGITTAVDIYGLGAVLYALLTGRPPFRGANIHSTIQQVQNDEPSAPTSLNRAVDTDLQTICLKCLNKEPSQRYQSAADLADDLERWHDGKPIVAKPASAWRRFTKWVRRQPMTASFIALAIAASMGLVIGLLVYNHNISEALAEANQLRKDGLKREDDLRELVYLAEMRSVKAMIDNGDVVSARQVLAKWVPGGDEPDLRGIEWNMLDRLTVQPVVLGRHATPALSVSLSPDERYLASGSEDGLVKIWDLQSRQVIREFQAAKRALTAVRFSPDGKTLATGSREYFIRMWDTGTWTEKMPLAGFVNSVRSMEFSHDGKRLAAGLMTGNFPVWSVDNPLPQFFVKGHKDFVGGIDWSADDSRLLSCSNDSTIKIWDTKTFKEISSLSQGRAIKVFASRFSPDGQLYAFGGGETVLHFLNAGANTYVANFPLQSTIRAIAFSKDSRFVAAVGSSGHIILVERFSYLQPLHQRRFLRQGTEIYRDVTFTKNNKWLIACSENGAVEMWDIDLLVGRTETPINRVQHSANDERMLVVLDNEALRIFDLEREIELGVLKNDPANPPAHSAVSRDGRWLAVANAKGQVAVWDVPTKVQRCVLDSVITRKCHALRFDTACQRLATANSEGGVHLWNLDGSLVREIRPHNTTGQSVRVDMRFTATDEELVVGVAEPEESWERWRLTDGQLLARHALGSVSRGNEIRPIALSPDGQRLAMSYSDRLIRVCDYQTGTTQCTLSGHSYDIRGLCFAPDSIRLFSTAADHHLKLWHLPTAQEILSFGQTTSRPDAPVFSPSSNFLVVPTAAHGLWRWNLNRP